MKRIRKIGAILITITLLLTAVTPAFAFSENESRSIESFFIESKLLKGDGGSYGFEKTPTRMEGIVILIRLLGKEAEAMQLQQLPCRFQDVPNWAVGYANYAYEENISKGVSDTLFGTNDVMTAQQFNTLLLRTIGYDDGQGDFRWDRSVDKANELGILPVDLADRYEARSKYTKRDLMETAFCYLEAEYKGEAVTLIRSLLDSGVIADELAKDYGLAVERWDGITTNVNESDSSTFELNKDTLSVFGRTTDENKKYILALIRNKETDAEKTEKVSAVDAGGEYDLTFPLYSLAVGQYYVDLYASNERYQTYTSFLLSSVIIEVTKTGEYFVPAPVYGQNLRFYKGNQLREQDSTLTLKTRLDSRDADAVKALASEITKGCGSDYEKLQAIHDWVAGNIYYDKDFFNGKTKTTNIDTMSVLKNRYAVCSGYSNLIKDLAAASGIPCRQVVGFALGITTKGGWENVDPAKTIPNHVWNEAYVDGRWVIIDATWDSGNKYEGGKLTAGEVSRLYFDTTVQFLSNTHMSMDFEL